MVVKLVAHLEAAGNLFVLLLPTGGPSPRFGYATPPPPSLPSGPT